MAGKKKGSNGNKNRKVGKIRELALNDYRDGYIMQTHVWSYLKKTSKIVGCHMKQS